MRTERSMEEDNESEWGRFWSKKCFCLQLVMWVGSPEVVVVLY